MPTRCAVYARYSSDQQRPESIADQIRHSRQEAARHTDWTVLDDQIYADQAVSGASVEGRSGLQRLVQAALLKPRPFDLILVDDTSRLSRDVVDTVQHFRELRFHGVDLFFVNQGLHSGRDNAEFLLAIYGAMDSEYIRELGRKTHRGLEGQALHGFSAGGIALGYQRQPLYDATATDRDGHQRRLGVRWIVDPSEAAVVQEIFQLYATGCGLAAIAAALNARGVPCPRQAKGHRTRRDSVGPGWDVSSVRVILMNEVYRGRLIWNRSRWVRVPGTRRRRRVMRPESEWVVKERPDLRIIEEGLWQDVQARRMRVRARYDNTARFGKSRSEYGKYLLSGLLVCGTCKGSMSIRTSSKIKSQKYGCTRRWRRGPSVCTNAILVRRDVAEANIARLLREKLYTTTAIDRLVEKVNARLRAQTPAAVAERGRLLGDLQRVGRQLDRLRQFILEGDTSVKVRLWLAEAEKEEHRLQSDLARAEGQAGRQPLQVHPGRAKQYLDDLRETLEKGGLRARQLLKGDIERIIVHSVLDAPKPFARAEVISTGKGLLERVAFVVAGARNAEC
jgi:DNA invertase Pin-like site-specific DNA recombinase